MISRTASKKGGRPCPFHLGFPGPFCASHARQRPTSQPGVAPKRPACSWSISKTGCCFRATRAATVSDLIADINAANTAGGANTITLTAPTTSPYVLTAVNNTTDGATGLPVIAANDNLTIVGNGDTIERSTARERRLSGCSTWLPGRR